MPLAQDFILDLRPGSVVCRFDLDFEQIRRLENDTSPPAVTNLILMQRLHSVPSGETLIDAVIETLAATAARLWPIWYTDVDFASLRAAELGPDRRAVEVLLANLPGASPIWFAWAARRMLAGRPLGQSAFPPESALQQLALAVSRDGLILVIAVTEAAPPPGTLLGLVHAAQWLARRGLAVVVLLPAVLEGHRELTSLTVAPVVLPVRAAEVPPVASSVGAAGERPAEQTDWPRAMDTVPGEAAPTPVDATPVDAGAVPPALPGDDLWLWPLTGRPHPLSEGERRLALAIAQDAELKPLFGCNRRVKTIYQSEPIVDLLWAEGRVVVEVDGDSHRQPGQYLADRHRDFELLVSGYVVLRLSNEEILIDTARALAKIRTVVAWRDHPKPETGFA